MQFHKYLVVFFLCACSFSPSAFSEDVKQESSKAKSTPAINITADKPEDQDLGYIKTDGDPLEPVNRGIFAINDVIDKAILSPVARTYKKVVPDWGREKIGNFVDNLKTPVTVVNSLLQGDVDNALTSFWRFFVNTTVGVGGLNDVGKEVGLKQREEDFGQTAGHYGVGPGPFLMLPVIGPSSLRDTVGFAADSASNPFNYVGGAAVAGKAATEGVHDRSEYLDLTDEIERTSFDPYSAYRSAYLQRRNDQINNGEK